MSDLKKILIVGMGWNEEVKFYPSQVPADGTLVLYVQTEPIKSAKCKSAEHNFQPIMLKKTLSVFCTKCGETRPLAEAKQ